MAAMNVRLLTASFLGTGLLWSGLLSAQTRPHWDAVLLADKGLFHYDPHTVSSAGQVRTFKSMVDYKTPQETSDGRKYLSSVTEIQLNCKRGVARIMHMSYHPEPMGAGKEVHKEGMVRDWLDIPAGSPIERIAKRIC